MSKRKKSAREVEYERAIRLLEDEDLHEQADDLRLFLSKERQDRHLEALYERA